MIQPLTCVCLLLACGSGLYLYQAKHRVQMIDREIEKTVRTTEAVREQTRVLHAEWTLQNDPQRLQVLAGQFLNLKTVTPGQFTSMSELDSRLPAMPAPEPPAPPPEVPVAEAPAPEERPAAPAPPPVPAPPPHAPVAAAVPAPPPHPPEHRPPPHPAVAEVQPVHVPPPLSPHPVIAAVAPHPIGPAAVPAPAATPAPPAVGGSALGMARNASAPPPRPTPVSASQWVNSGGGGG